MSESRTKSTHEEELMCPLCHGTGKAPRAEAARYLAENAGEAQGRPLPPVEKAGELAAVGAAASGHSKQVRSYPDTEVLWRRSPKE